MRAEPDVPRHGRRWMASIRAILGHGQRGAKNEAAHRRAGGHHPDLPVRLVATAAHGRAAGAGRPDAKERGSEHSARRRADGRAGRERARADQDGRAVPPCAASQDVLAEDR